jgi:hypothetical protein
MGVCQQATLPACGGLGGACCGGFCGSCAGTAVCSNAICVSPNPARLFVGSDPNDGGTRLLAWDQAQSVSATTPPSVNVPLTLEPRGLLTDPNTNAPRILVLGNGAALFQNAMSMTSASTPSTTLPSSTVVLGLTAKTFFTGTNTWVSDFNGDMLRFDALTALTSSSMPVKFVHPFNQIYGAAYDATGDRLIGGQVSGAGVLVFENASTATGTMNMSSFQLLNEIQEHLVTLPTGIGVRLFSATYASGNVHVWTNIAGVTGPTAPSFTLTALPATLSGIRNMRAFGDTLMVMGASVVIYRNASLLTASSMPSVTLTDPSFSLATDAFLGSDDTLYVLTSDGVAIFGTGSTTPVFRAKLPVTNPSALTVLE